MPFPEIPDALTEYYSDQEAASSMRVIRETLGRKWLRLATSRHPLKKAIQRNTIYDFVFLLSFSSDLFFTRNTPGFEHIVRDLKNPHSFFPTSYTAHCAALVGRPSDQSLYEFFYDNEERVPDFGFSKGTHRVACECKLVMASSDSKEFIKQTNHLEQKIVSYITNSDFRYFVEIIFRSFSSNLDIAGAEEAVYNGISLVEKKGFPSGSSALAIIHENWFVNIAKPLIEHEDIYSEYAACFIYCKRSENEDTKLLRQAKKSISPTKNQDRQSQPHDTLRWPEQLF